MTWVKIDDAMHQNTKVRGVSLAARWTYIASICRSGATQSDGEILGCDLSLVDGTTKIAKELVAAGLWETTMRGSYVIHDYLVYNRSRLQIAETAKINAENGKRGLATRYAKRLANGEPTRLANGLANGLTNARSENSVLTPSSSLGVPDTQNQASEPPSDSLKRHKPIDDDFLNELAEEFPTVRVRDVLQRAMNRKTWDGYKDKRRALREYCGYDLDKQRGNGNGRTRTGNVQQRPDDEDPIERRLRLDAEREGTVARVS
jgi:hypothetical protein